MYGLDTGDSVIADQDQPTLRTIRTAADIHSNKDARRKVRFKSVAAHSDPIGVLYTIREQMEGVELGITEHEDHYQIDLSRRIVRSDIEGGERTVSGTFAFYQNEASDVWTALTGSDPDFYERGLLWLLKRGQPDISNFYVTSADLENVLDRVRNSCPPDTQITVTKAVAYSHQEEGNISFETHPYYQVFDIADDSGRYVDKITFEVRGSENLLFKGFVSRDGRSKFISGDPGLFFNTFLPAYTDEGHEKAELFSDKERSEETGEVNEIEIDFDQQVFRSPDDNMALIRALSNLTQSSITVYHKNPYAHLSILDYVDGSSCDVVVTDSNTVSIIPSYRGSLNSLMRISEQISREFQEGTVSEADQADFEFADFFAD